MLRKNYTFYESNKYPHKMYNYEKFHSVGGITLKPKIYIDGKDGTTGLQIYDRLSARSDIDLLLIDESKRKDPAERKKLLNAADLVFLCLPDAAAVEANEGMIKLARKYSFDRYGTGRATIITLNNSFHGRTITTLTATGQEVFHNYFFPFTEGFRYADVNSLESLEAAAGDDVCAVMLELVQGEGGVLPLEPAYVQAVKKLCEERDWLLLVDEVQTGVGRTGKLFAFQNDGILPDVASFAKGIAGGLPMSGIMANEKCRNVLGPGTHATTFGANPVCAAAGLLVQETLTDDFLAEVQAKGDYLRKVIEALNLPCFGKTRGMGLMIGIEVRDGYDKGKILSRLIENGLLVLTAGPGMRLLPPLTITKAELDQGLEIMKKALENF